MVGTRTSRAPLRLAVLDDGPRHRQGTIDAVAHLAAIELVAEGSLSAEGVVLLASYLPDLAIVGVYQPDQRRLAEVEQLHQASPETGLILQIAHEPHFSEGWIQAARVRGAAAFVRYTARNTDLLRAIHEVSATIRFSEVQIAPERLTPREAEILALLTKGWTDRQIAAALGIKEATVGAYTRTIYPKLGIQNRRQLMNGEEPASYSASASS